MAFKPSEINHMLNIKKIHVLKKQQRKGLSSNINETLGEGTFQANNFQLAHTRQNIGIYLNTHTHTPRDTQPQLADT